MNKMTYEEFKKKEFERACKNDRFDKNGSSVLATVSRSFIAEIRIQVGEFNRAILDSVDLKVLAQQLFSLVLIVSIPVTYVPFLMLRAALTRRRAKLTSFFIFELAHFHDSRAFS
jgi:hypothetical protein